MQLAELGEEAERSGAAALAVERRIRTATAAAGIDPGLPPLAAVAAFRDACARRREHDRLPPLSARRGGASGSVAPSPDALERQRGELAGKFAASAGILDAAVDVAVDAAALAELERIAVATRERADAAASEVQRLAARLKGLTGTLPPSPTSRTNG